jgi:hypothetical protein
MKIFDEKNPRHIQILKEEIIRAKQILKEYNESDLWKNLSIDVRKAALMSVDDDMGPDFADEYANTEWMQLPDVITNRIDLNRFEIPDNINPMALANFIQQNASKLPNVAWYQASVGPKLRTDQIVKLLQSGLTSTKYLTKDIIGHILSSTPDITIDYKQLIDSSDSASFTPISPQGSGTIGGATKNKDWRGGMYTGD